MSTNALSSFLSGLRWRYVLAHAVIVAAANWAVQYVVPGTADFLVRHFDRFVIKGLKIDKHPQLLPLYFGNYKRVMFLVQVPDEALEKKAQAAAARLGLPLEVHYTGLAGIEPFLAGSADVPVRS